MDEVKGLVELEPNAKLEMLSYLKMVEHEVGPKIVQEHFAKEDALFLAGDRISVAIDDFKNRSVSYNRAPSENS